MSASKWFTELGGQVLQGVNAAFGEALNAVVEGTEGAEDADFGFIQVAYAYKPKPITPKDFILRTPYANPKALKANMAASAERGWLETVGEGQYAVSAKGAEVVGRLLDSMNGAVNGIESLPKADLVRIHTLLQKVGDKTRKLPEPAEKWVLEWGQYFQKALVVEDAPTLVKVRRRLLDMFAYRDDSHVAAWKAHEENGQIWEAFTFIWRGDLGTAAELAETLPFRNYDQESYAAALSKLEARGWIGQKDSKYVATEKGKKLRQAVEDDTDRYFDAPWDALTEAETKELKGLLGKLAEAVKPPEPEEAQE